MSGFNTIKKSRKRSHEIEEKLNVLNRELEKTKDIQEQPTMHTGDLYTKVQQSEPSDFQGPLDVPNTAGVGEDDFTQSSAGTGEDGHASSYSSDSLYLFGNFDLGSFPCVFISSIISSQYIFELSFFYLKTTLHICQIISPI